MAAISVRLFDAVISSLEHPIFFFVWLKVPSRLRWILKYFFCLKVFPRRQSHSQNNTSLFLASLAVADLLFLLLYLPLDIWRQVDSSVYQVSRTGFMSSVQSTEYI